MTAFGFSIAGQDVIVHRFRTMGRDINVGGGAGLRRFGERVKAQADEWVPLDTGALQSSGRVQGPGRRSDGKAGVEVTVSYGRDDVRHPSETPTSAYSIIQHEDLTLHHPMPGRRAKFLELALITQIEEAKAMTAAEVWKALRRAVEIGGD